MVTLEVDGSDGENKLSKDGIGSNFIFDVINDPRENHIHSLDISYLRILVSITHQNVLYFLLIEIVLKGE